MLSLPQRRQFPTRDDFAAAVSATYADLFARYEAEPILVSKPDWASNVYNVALPIDIAREGGAPHGISSIIKHAIEMGKSSIGRIAHVENNGMWTVFFEAS